MMCYIKTFIFKVYIVAPVIKQFTKSHDQKILLHVNVEAVQLFNNTHETGRVTNI